MHNQCPDGILVMYKHINIITMFQYNTAQYSTVCAVHYATYINVVGWWCAWEWGVVLCTVLGEGVPTLQTHHNLRPLTIIMQHVLNTCSRGCHP
jgi:hypothetical protein